MDPDDFRNNVDGIAFASDAVHCVIVQMIVPYSFTFSAAHNAE
jgi:hypothetical protein